MWAVGLSGPRSETLAVLCIGVLVGVWSVYARDTRQTPWRELTPPARSCRCDCESALQSYVWNGMGHVTRMHRRCLLHPWCTQRVANACPIHKQFITASVERNTGVFFRTAKTEVQICHRFRYSRTVESSLPPRAGLTSQAASWTFSGRRRAASPRGCLRSENLATGQRAGMAA